MAVIAWRRGRSAARRRLAIASVGLVLLAGSGVFIGARASASGTGGPSLHVVAPNDQPSVRFELRGLDRTVVEELRRAGLTQEQWEHVFAVRTGADGRPPVAGTYAVTGDGIRFTPVFPLVAGMTYVAHADLARLARASRITALAGHGGTLEIRHSVPAVRESSRGIVTQVYPTADTVPANLLKFYVHFSRPMRLGEAARHIVLLDARGDTAQDTFLQLDDEMWNAAGTRLTVFLDPGRIKRGLRPHRERGMPLEVGRRYQLQIDGAWPDADGVPLREGFTKSFVVAGADRTVPTLGAWRVTAPPAGTRDAIVLESPELLDHALAERGLAVRSARGELVPVAVTTSNEERTVRLSPRREWDAGEYQVVIDAELEDLAGNNFRRLFDVDLEDRAAYPREEIRSLTIPVVIPSAGARSRRAGESLSSQ